MKSQAKKLLTLPRHPFLKAFPSKYKNLVLKNAYILDVPKGKLILKDGQKSTHFYLLLKGSVDLLAEEQDVRFDPESSIGILQTLKSGDVLGWSWLIPPYHWRFDARAAENTKLLALDGIHIRKEIAKNHSFAHEIYKRLVPVMNNRLIAARLKLQTFGGQPFLTEEGG